MIDHEKFTARHAQRHQIAPFSAVDLADMAKKLPPDIVEFLSAEGRCSYSNGTLWTVYPGEFHEILSDWGLDGKKCHAFFRTAFGGCIYYFRKKFYFFDSLTGTINCLNDDVYTLISAYLTMTFLLHDTWHLQHLEDRADLPAPLPDEIYGLVPALPFGGSFESSRLEVVKMREHLAFLAECLGNQVKKL